MNPIELVTPNVGMWFWTTLLFLAVLIILRKTAWGPIVKALEEREKTIADDLKRAESARVDAEGARESLLKEQAKMLAEQNDRVAQMMKNAEHRAADIIEQAKVEAQKQRETATAEIEREKQKAIASIRSEVVTVALNAAQAVIGRELKPEDHQRLIEQSINHLN
ncbi:MAG: F0F1 ATP synthase subunit B [bacterium]|nr:F0F1 ATP synthase subunit B [bacterium]